MENNPYKAECSKLVLVGLKFLFGTTWAVYEKKDDRRAKTWLKNNSVCFGMGVSGKTMSPSHLPLAMIPCAMSVPASSDVNHLTYRKK